MKIILATCGTDEADQLAKALVAERLIGCCNIVPGVRSHYWWDGEVCSDAEALLVMETTADRVDEACRRLKSLHGYTVPKIVVLAPEGCDADYLAWLRRETRPG